MAYAGLPRTSIRNEDVVRIALDALAALAAWLLRLHQYLHRGEFPAPEATVGAVVFLYEALHLAAPGVSRCSK